MTDQRLADLIESANQAELKFDDSREVEPYYGAVLDALLANPALRAEAVGIFIRGISILNTHSFALTAYCMHTLRWPEIREAVLRLSEPQDTADWRRRSQHFPALLRAFEDNWGGRELYRRYSGP